MGVSFQYLMRMGMSMNFENGYGYRYSSTCPEPIPRVESCVGLVQCLDFRGMSIFLKTEFAGFGSSH